MATSATQKLSREDFKRQKAIEEQRKAGTLPAEVDPETGRDINPHIPHYIASAPWYLDIGHPTLKHQRVKEDNQGAIGDWYARGTRAGPAAKKYRKGACENCGSMTHKAKDCMDRPRKVGAKHSNKDIQADEVLSSVELGFEAKRDRWNGYDATEYMQTIQEWELIDEQRRKIREQQAKAKLSAGASSSSAGGGGGGGGGNDSDEDEGDEDKYADSADMPGQKLDTKTRTTVRNLRIREDTAKYLLNLDVNSAYYDPKTRSMRDNPVQEKEDSDVIPFAGDNFVRYTGDSIKMAQLQLFAWDAASHGKDVHLQSNPTQAELLNKEYLKKKDVVSETVKDSILARYGGEEHLKAPPKELLLAQTEQYVEYSQTGRLIKGQEKASVKSKYEEDVYPLNHTAVWGSYWKDGKWGYACCHSFSKNAYCTGEAGKEAAKASQQLLEKLKDEEESSSSSQKRTLLEQHVAKIAKDGVENGSTEDGASGSKKRGRGERLGEGDVQLDPKKLKKAIEQEELRRQLAAEGDDDERGWKGKGKGKGKGKYNSMNPEREVTEEELEAYRLKKANAFDPMANYKDEEDM
ncbi:mRNA splicing protein [Quaeritorhiza haematococci]|nr:mRNA splicing protein [Quaeritorhiza haematococci]